MSQFTNELCGIAAEIANGTYTRKDVKTNSIRWNARTPKKPTWCIPLHERKSHGIWRTKDFRRTSKQC